MTTTAGATITYGSRSTRRGRAAAAARRRAIASCTVSRRRSVSRNLPGRDFGQQFVVCVARRAQGLHDWYVVVDHRVVRLNVDVRWAYGWAEQRHGPVAGRLVEQLDVGAVGPVEHRGSGDARPLRLLAGDIAHDQVGVGAHPELGGRERLLLGFRPA